MPLFPLELIAPEQTLLSEKVKSVRAPGQEGSFGILAGHAPLMAALGTGVIKVEHENGDIEYIATSGGFLQTTYEKTIILADTAERAPDIDVTRAEAAIARAKERLESGEAIDYDRARKALERSTNRLKVVQMHKEA
jgi:F-type H+-transporting ATPase subunit epsilon